MENIEKAMIVWSNCDLDLEAFRTNTNNPKASFDDMINESSLWYESELENLNFSLENEIIVIADLGLWNGRKNGYKLIESGKISDCLEDDGDYVEWYVDKKGEFRCTASHHDGTNYYHYREFKQSYDDNVKGDFCNKITNGHSYREGHEKIYPFGWCTHCSDLWLPA